MAKKTKTKKEIKYKSIRIDIHPEFYNILSEEAKFNSMPISQLAKERLEWAIDNKYVLTSLAEYFTSICLSHADPDSLFRK